MFYLKQNAVILKSFCYPLSVAVKLKTNINWSYRIKMPCRIIRFNIDLNPTTNTHEGV